MSSRPMARASSHYPSRIAVATASSAFGQLSSKAPDRALEEKRRKPFIEHRVVAVADGIDLQRDGIQHHSLLQHQQYGLTSSPRARLTKTMPAAKASTIRSLVMFASLWLRSAAITFGIPRPKCIRMCRRGSCGNYVWAGPRCNANSVTTS